MEKLKLIIVPTIKYMRSTYDDEEEDYNGPLN